jgi:MraZ protein
LNFLCKKVGESGRIFQSNFYLCINVFCNKYIYQVRMAYFSGEYDCSVDAKGRMLIPSKVKSRLPEGFAHSVYLVKSTDPCLVIYAIPEWEKVADKVTSLNEFDENTAFIQRNFLRNSLEVELDSLGRFLIPKKMLEYAGLSKDAILVGLGNRLELWEPDRYEQYLANDPKEFAQLLTKHLGSAKNE